MRELNNLVVYEASIDDLETLAELFDKYRVFYKQPSDLFSSKNFIQQRIINKESVIFLALARDAKEKKIGLGFVQLYPSFSSVYGQRLWILNDLYVNENYRRSGIAKKLMNEAKKFALKTNAKELVLQTATDNHTAQLLYDSLGYKKNEKFYEYSLALKSTSEIENKP